MNNTLPAYIGGIVRIITTLLGGYLAQKGLATEVETEGIIGAIMVVATGIWSIWAKRKALAVVPPGAVKVLTVLCLLTASFILSGCAVISGKAGASSYVGLAFGEKASAQLAGLNITETETKTKAGVSVFDRGVGLDKSSASGEADMGKILGNLLLLGLQSQGVPAASAVKAVVPDVEQEEDAVIVPTPAPAVAPVVSKPKSVVTAEGVPVVAILGNRLTCSRCRTLWGALDATALSEALCGASVIDADKTDNAAEYARLRPNEAFAYPLVIVYSGDGKLAGRFSASGLTQAALAAKVKALVPACAATQ